MLKDIRKEKGISQIKLSELSKVSLKTIQKYEQGERDINKASGKILYNIAKVLGCRMEDLLNKEDIEREE